MHDKIKSTLNSSNACYRLVQPFALPLVTYENKDSNIQNYKRCRLWA